eukprot:156170-Amphidinium_carterae.1
MNRFWLPGLVFALSGLMGLASKPRFRSTDTVESVLLPLPGLKQSVHRAEFLAVVRALEECKPKWLSLAVPPAGVQIVWMKAHQSERDAEYGRVDHSDLQGNRLADMLLPTEVPENMHVPLEPSEEWKQWGTVCEIVGFLWARSCVFVLSSGPGHASGP